MDFKAYLDYFGWSKARFAREIGVSPDTVSRWKEPPQLVMRFLELLHSSSELQQAERYFLEHPEVMISLYRLHKNESPLEVVKKVDPKSISDLELLKIIRSRRRLCYLVGVQCDDC